MIMLIGVEDPTNGYYAPTQMSKGLTADIAMNDGHQVRKEYLQAMSD